MSQKNNFIHSLAEVKIAMAELINDYVPSKAIVRHELKLKPVDQLNWLAAQDAVIKVFGANQDDSAAIAGIGAAAVCKGVGAINYGSVLKQLRSQLCPQYPYLQWYGGFCFDPQKNDAAWKTFGSWHFVLPQFELARDKDKMIFACNLIGPINKAKLLATLNALKEPTNAQDFHLNHKRRKDYPTKSTWEKSVQSVLKSIRSGKCEKVVLARKTDFTFDEALNPWAILKTLKKVTPSSYHFAFAFGNTVFLGASPERLYKRYGRLIFSEALAGTIPSKVAPRHLLHSAKDRHEHQVVVNTIAAALKPLCDQLKYENNPQIRTLSNGHHLNTPFEGHLKDGVRDEDVLKSLHPTPAVGGLPQNVALNTIRKEESFGRGWYAGPLGYVGLDWTELVVGIRSGLVRGKQLSVFAGAGIVEGSQPESEWQEIENKISNFIRIIR